MEDTPTPTNEELTPENLNKKINEIRTELLSKIATLQSQLDELLKHSDANDNKQNSQIVRVALLLDNAMDNIHGIIGLLADVNNKIANHDQQIWSHGNSISINKRNVAELSKYIKEIDKVWQEARAVINQLSDDNEANKQSQVVVKLICGGALVVVTWFISSGHCKTVWDWITSFF